MACFNAATDSPDASCATHAYYYCLEADRLLRLIAPSARPTAHTLPHIQEVSNAHIDDARMVQVPLRAMAKHLQVRDEEGWDVACRFLLSLTHESDAKKTALAQHGAVTALQQAMQVCGGHRSLFSVQGG
jgi:hypothetical protein